MLKPTYETALIVGAGSGLSASLARLLTSEGLRVALAARNSDKLAPLCAETGSKAFACDAVDASAVATSLRAKHFPAIVVNPTTDKYYHVQVGPYHDVKSADAAKKGLESAGFKAIVKH